MLKTVQLGTNDVLILTKIQEANHLSTPSAAIRWAIGEAGKKFLPGVIDLSIRPAAAPSSPGVPASPSPVPSPAPAVKRAARPRKPQKASAPSAPMLPPGLPSGIKALCDEARAKRMMFILEDHYAMPDKAMFEMMKTAGAKMEKEGLDVAAYLEYMRGMMVPTGE